MQSNSRFIDSANRRSTSASPTDFTIDITRVEDVYAFQITKLSYFNNQYNIDSRNNKMYYTDSDAVAQTITLTSGRYTGTTLKTEISTQMNAASTPAITVSYSTLTNKFTIADAGGNFELTTTTTTNAVWDYIGFTTDADKTGADTYTGTNQSVLTSKFYYITIDIADNGDLSSDLPNDVAMIIINNQSWGSLTQIDGNDEIVKTHRDSFTSMRVRLYDDKHNIVDTSGIDWSFMIEFFNEKNLLLKR